MNKINLLSKDISELIAAGEVIERPASVIKELLENSIDSGANLITIEIKNGGISYIRITDNGCGMSKVDVPMAFLRHATSKISTASDLDKIITLGFRGEALASISAVAKIDLITKVSGSEYGTHYVIEGSEEKLIEECGCPDGTTIVIRDIFYNIPARLKFLKKAVTEGNSVSAIINKIALTHPEISFKFIRDNKQELLTPGDGKLYSAVYSVFGRDFAKTLIPVNYSNNNIKITGYTVKPLFSRANRAFQTFFVNNRFVKSVTCTVSLEEAYKNSVMTGKFPACVLNLEIPPDIVDVNVHPAKIEIRFADEKLIFDSVYFAIKNALLQEDKPEELRIETKKNFSANQLFDVKPFEAEKSVQLKMNVDSMTFETNQKSYSSTGNETFVNSQNIYVPESPAKPHEIIVEDNFKYINKDSFIKKEPIIKENIIVEDNNVSFNINIIGEAFMTYIIAQVDDELLLIDKHAAHERYIFEKIKSNHDFLQTQLLLSPLNVMLSNEEFDIICMNSDIINKLGFSFNEGKGTTITVTGVPSALQGYEIDSLISELAENLILNKQNPSSGLLDELYHSIACKSAIKANDKSSKEELTELVRMIYNDENIRYCPHGRPVMIKLTKKEIEKQFKRIV